MGSELGLGFSPWISGYQVTGMDHSKCLGERLKPNPAKRNAKHSFYPFLCRMHSFHTLLLETFCTLDLQTRRKLFRVWTSSKYLVKDSLPLLPCTGESQVRKGETSSDQMPLSSQLGWETRTMPGTALPPPRPTPPGCVPCSALGTRPTHTGSLASVSAC